MEILGFRVNNNKKRPLDEAIWIFLLNLLIGCECTNLVSAFLYRVFILDYEINLRIEKRK